MRRRDFLKRVSAVGLMAALPARLADRFLSVPSIPVLPAVGVPLTFAMLHEAFIKASFGKQAPSLILVSPERFRMFARIFSPCQQWTNPERSLRNLRFCGADLCADPTQPDDLIRFVNEHHPDDPRLNISVRLQPLEQER